MAQKIELQERRELLKELLSNVESEIYYTKKEILFLKCEMFTGISVYIWGLVFFGMFFYQMQYYPREIIIFLLGIGWLVTTAVVERYLKSLEKNKEKFNNLSKEKEEIVLRLSHVDFLLAQ